MNKFWRFYRITTAVIITLGIVAMYKSGSTGSYGLNFFSYFTIQSNIIAIIVLLIGEFYLYKHNNQKWDYIRGASVLYMLVTAIVYIILFEKNTVYHTLLEAFGDIVVHKIAPLLIVADFVLNPFLKSISLKKILAWMGFPALWLFYTFVRGGLTNWYPYSFLNPTTDAGWSGVIKYCLGIAVGVWILCIAVGLVGNRKCGPERI